MVLTVRDDGAGFDVDRGAARTGHYGLRGMTERAASMGAHPLHHKPAGAGNGLLYSVLTLE